MNLAISHSDDASSITARLSARTAATFLELPAVEQMKVLYHQKYPRKAPQRFQIRYYQGSLSGIRLLIERGLAGLADARAALQRIINPTQRMNNMRVLEAFAASGMLERGLVYAPMRNYYATLSGVEFRLSPQLIALDGKDKRIIYLNLRFPHVFTGPRSSDQ